MKKFISTMLAAVMISSCIVTPAFAYPSEVPEIGEIQYGEGRWANTKINAFNTDARVYPTSQAPELKNTKTINGITFSEYIKHKEVDYIADNGEKVHQVSVWLGVDSAMHSSAKDARFIYHYGGFYHHSIWDDVRDCTMVTGERSNWSVGDKFIDLEFRDIKPYADNKTSSGEYVGNLTWQFLKYEQDWENYHENLRIGFTESQYSHSYDIITIINGVQTNFCIVTTTEGTPKGDDTPVTSTTFKETAPKKNTFAYIGNTYVFVNDKRVVATVCTIDGYSYFKLRDLASILNGTEKQFSVGWDNVNKAVSMTTGRSYTGNPAVYSKIDGQRAKLSDSPVYVNGAKKDYTVYNIDGNNYFKLRDMAKDLNFYLEYGSNEVKIDTTKGYQ